MATDPHVELTGRRPQSHTPEPRTRASERVVSWWIENDGLLRDEGAVFGLSGIPTLPESKIEAVTAYYRARIAHTEARRWALLEERERLTRRVEALGERIEWLSRNLWRQMASRADARDSGVDPEPPNAPDPSLTTPRDVDPSSIGHRAFPDDSLPTTNRGGLLRYGLGTLCAAATCVLTYFVVREVLGDAVRYPELTSIAVILAGMFTVFAPTSLLFSSDRRHREQPWEVELWKVRLAEIGFPIVAAAFVVAWGERRDPLRDLLAFSFIALLFLFGGRLFLSLLTRSKYELQHAVLAWRRRARERLRRRELKRLEMQIATLNHQLAAVDEEIRRLPGEEELRAECDHKVALLRSEFELARVAVERGLVGNVAFELADEQ